MDDRGPLLDEAKTHDRAGRLREAEALYRQVITSGEATAEAFFLHGLCCEGLGLVGEAVASLRQAVVWQPKYADAHHRLGLLLAGQGQIDEAIAALEQARQLAPDATVVAENLRRVRAARDSTLAAGLARRGEIDAATRRFRDVVALLPEDADAHYNLGVALLSQEQLDEAITCFRRALQLNPGQLDACFRLANSLTKRRRLDEAAVYYRRLLSRKADHAGALNNLGNVLRELGQLDEAVDCCRQAVTLDPHNGAAHNNLGVALMNQEKLEEALACYAEALRLKPDYVEPYANRATARLMQDRPEEALAQCELALQLDTRHAAAHHNASFALLSLGRIDEALARGGRAVELNPEDAQLHFNHAMTLLLTGKFDQGWREYEWRWKRPGHEEVPLARPRWNGEPLGGRTILLRTEQGYGDSLQFIRYAQLVKQRGGRVIVECEAPLQRLLASCPGVDATVVRGDALPPFDVHLPLLSLPLIFNTSMDTIPSSAAYLAASEEAVSHWRAELAREGSFKVGLVWRGNPANLIDRRRSIPLVQFAPLARVPKVRLYSLQFGAARDELPGVAGDWPITDLAEPLSDFHDTAAVMRNLDLVISCDSSPCHVAGAIGTPVWVALPFVPDWRWGLEGSDTPWYPTMRLFRQARRGAWDDVIRRIAEKLTSTV